MRWPVGLRTAEFQYTELILLAVLVGVLGALGNLCFRALIAFFSWVFRGLEWQALGIAAHPWLAMLTPLVLLSGGATVLLLDRLFGGDVLGYGFPSFLEMVNRGSARVKRRWLLTKSLGAAISLGAGASVGREGPIAQIGGAIGSAIARWRRLPTDRAKVLIAAGAGAGIATIFNAPIGGLMFAQEIVLLGESELANLTLLIIATTSGVVASRVITGNSVVFPVPAFVLRSYWELLTYGLMGVLMGLLGAGYVRFFHATAAFFQGLKLPQWGRLALGLFAVGLIAVPLPQNLSDGYSVIDAALFGKLPVRLMAVLAAAKFFTSSVSLGCGMPGGVFGPTFFIGTMAGGSFRYVSALLLPGLTGPRGSYALIGLGAFLAGVTHAPLTALFLLFEMSNDYQVTLPAMVATISALVVARALESESLDTYALARAGKKLEIGRERLLLSQIPVGSVMSHEVTSARQDTALVEVLRLAGETAQTILPVVGEDGDFKGLVVTHDLLSLLSSERDLGPLVNADDLCRRDAPRVTPDSTLDQANQLMEAEELDELPVVEYDEGGKLVGIVARKSIAQALNRIAVSLTTLGTQDDNIYWATGYRVARVKVPPAARDKTLRALDPRARFGVSVLAIQDSADPARGFMPVAPDQRLKPGDLLVAAGHSADLRRFVRDLEGNG